MKIKNIITVLSIAMFFISCEQDLDLTPKDKVSDGSFWKTPKDFEMAANDFYGALPGFGTPANSTDFAFGHGPNSYSNGTYLAPDDSNHWKNSYAAIRGINYMLSKSENYAQKTEINRWLGEAYFFRAWQYFGLLKSYGGVPIITKVLTPGSKELFAPRNTRAEVADLIVKDLQQAVNFLPLKSELASNETGKITKGAAQTFLSRVALYEGTWEKYHGGDKANEFLTIAVKAAKDVIDLGQYQLYFDAKFGKENSYRKLFIEDGEDNSEVILSRRYVKDINGSHNHTRWLEQNITNPSKAMADSYVCTDGLPIDKSPLFKGYSTMASEFENRDPRMAQSIFRYGDKHRVHGKDKVYDKPVFDGPYTRTGYTARKYLGESDESWGGNAVYDYIAIRLGEAMLNYAEAKFELSGSISDADLDFSINKLRDRVGIAHLTNALVSANGLDMKTEIRRERNVELASEGFHFSDLMRWKTAEIELPKAIRGIKYKGTEYETLFPDLKLKVDADGFIVAEEASGRSFDPTKHYLRPLPKKQIKQNPALKQNPGW